MNSNIFRLTFLFCCLFTLNGFSQIKVGNNPTTINANSVLEVESTNKGLLLPRIALTATNAAAPLSAHIAGMTVYNTATAGTAPYDVVPAYYYNDGIKWNRIAINDVDTTCGNVEVNQNDPNTVGTVFDPNTPTLTCAIYAAPDGSLWSYNGSSYVTATNIPKVEPWYNRATAKPADNNYQQLFHLGSVNIGTSTTPGRYSLTVGSLHNVTGFSNIASGALNTISSNYSGAIGYSNTISGARSVALGTENINAGSYTITGGRSNEASGSYAVAFGYLNKSLSTYSFTAGTNNNVNTGHSSVAMGLNNTVTGVGSIAVGNTNLAEGNYSVAMGYLDTVKASYASVFGYNNSIGTASTSSFIGGYGNTIEDNATYSTAFGFGNTISGTGDYGVAMGRSNVVTGLYGIAMGNADTASGNYAIALGNTNTASGIQSVALGCQDNFVSGNYSYSLGLTNTVSGTNSYAFGRNATVTSNYSTLYNLTSVPNTVAQNNTFSVMGGNVGIGTTSPTSKLAVVGLPVFADNTAAASLSVGDFYRTSTGVVMVKY